MDFETYSQSKQFEYAALAETVVSILNAALAAHPDMFRLQQVQARAKSPESLKKKVTLLKHFRNYLLQQQQACEDEAYADSQSDAFASTDLVYVKKWVRTKHAILFSLSNRTVQVIFYDQTEILLTPDVALLTYVDKHRKRFTHNFNDELVGSSAEIEKRLKYTREIMLQLLSGQRS